MHFEIQITYGMLFQFSMAYFVQFDCEIGYCMHFEIQITYGMLFEFQMAHFMQLIMYQSAFAQASLG